MPSMITPRQRLAVGAVACALAVWLTVWLAVGEPWLGITLAGNARGEIYVEALAPAGPAEVSGLKRGMRVSALRGDSGAIGLLSGDLQEDPDFVPTYDAYNLFMVRQQKLSEILQSPSVTLDTDAGRFDVTPQTRPLTALPAMFWYQLLCGLVAVLTGLGVLVFRHRSQAARAYGLTGLSFLLITFTAAPYSSRELALPGHLFRLLSAGNHLGSMLFSGAFLGLLWHYPTPLGRLPLHKWLLGGFLGLWLLDTLQWLPDIDLGVRLPIIIALFVSMGFATLQWRRSNARPVERAALKWFMFSILLAGTTFVMAIVITTWLGLPRLLKQGYAFGLVLFMYLGVAFGILRYRLFDLERWWVSVWFWLLTGSALIAVDMLLVYLLELSHALALSISLALIGWIYLPLRQWLHARLLGSRRPRLEELFPRLLHLGLISESSEALERGWHELVQQVFDPLWLKPAESAADEAAIGAEGVELTLPALGPVPALCLSYPAQGRRLFSIDDLSLARSLWELARRALDDRRQYDQGMRAERERIASDLHDDLGGRLLTLTHRAADPALAELARDSLRELRSVVTNLVLPACLLEEAAPDWRAEAEERCNAAGVAFSWQIEPAAGKIRLGTAVRLNLLRILREAMSNALRHAGATRIEVKFVHDTGRLKLSVRDNGRTLAPDQWPPGRGLANMRKRARDLGSQLRIDAVQPHGAEISVVISPELKRH